jgi:hypothetical protein
MVNNRTTDIASLTELTTPGVGDLVPIQDTSTGITKHIKAENLIGFQYGSIHAPQGTAASQAPDTTWTKCTAFTTNGGESNGVALDQSSNNISIPANSVCWVQYEATVSVSNTASNPCHMRLYLSTDGAQASSEQTVDIGTATDYTNITGSCILTTGASAETVEVQIKLGAASAHNYLVDSINLTVLGIAPA